MQSRPNFATTALAVLWIVTGLVFGGLGLALLHRPSNRRTRTPKRRPRPASCLRGPRTGKANCSESLNSSVCGP
jgi:hypothetical protein